MSRTDSRATLRELKIDLERMKADPNIKCDRRNWGTFADRRTIRIFKRHHNKQLRYIGRREILLDQER